MKTPKREYKKYHICPATGEPDEWALGNIDARWKRKNRIRQLKATIARQLLQENHLSPWLNYTIIKILRENV